MAFGDNGSPLEMLTFGNRNPCWILEKNHQVGSLQKLGIGNWNWKEPRFKKEDITDSQENKEK